MDETRRKIEHSGPTTVNFMVNGEPVSATTDSNLTLMRFLRDELRLTGAKNGCTQGHCGACTVIIDGKAERSCLVKITRVNGKRVETIEGLSSGGQLHPIQRAYLESGAVQCGFCTPGLIMATKALLDRNPSPSDDEIKDGLKNNICRCTGYVKVIQAVRMAARWRSGAETPPEASPAASLALPATGLGVSIPDLDGEAKVTGRLLYADDYYPEGMLAGKVLWSVHPHAEILSIDTTAARAVPGVVAVLTADDVPGANGFGSLKPDHPVLCKDRARYVGDAVAVVFAETEEAAERSRREIRVEYRKLEGVFCPQRALEPDAPKLFPEGNISKHLVHEIGDVKTAFTEADVVVEGHFETPFVEHAYLEPEAGYAYIDENGTVTVCAGTQFPFENRRQIMAMLGLKDPKDVRCITTPLGGGFGSRCDITVECLLALGAYKTRRPVKITLTREESMRVSTKRHAYFMDYRVAARKDGKLLGVEAKLLSDAGPYTALSPRVIDQACIFSCGPYVVENVRVEGWAMHTNNANGSAFRGFGINQAAVAIETLVDEVARKLGMDPFDIRMKNALDVGEKTISGEILKASVGLKASIREAKAALDRYLGTATAPPPGKKIGIGVASGFKNVGAGKGKVDNAGAIVELKPDGSIRVRVSAVDMGQGIRTTLAQITSEATGIPAGRIEMITGDTELTPEHGGAVGERQTLISGNAMMHAAKLFRDKLLAEAAEAFGVPAENLRIEGGSIVSAPGTKGRASWALAELARAAGAQGREIKASYYYEAPRTYPLSDAEARRTVPPEEYRNYPAYAYTTQVAIVEVDENTGEVKVKKIIAAHDVGRAINPQKIEGQLEGSCSMGQGYALSEAYVLEEGVPKTNTLKRLGLPTIFDTPEIESILIEDPEPSGPFGAKGISEVATVPVTPAILNAIHDATGVMIRSLPATKDKILAGLRGRG